MAFKGIMARVKIGKLTIVILLTVLIWVWVDLALEEELTLSRIPVNATNTDQTLWMSFLDDGGGLSNILYIEELNLRGPASTVRTFEHRRDSGMFKVELFLSPERFAGQAGRHALPLLDFLRKSESIRDIGLTVESCTPDIAAVEIVPRVRKDIKIRCVDENGIVINAVVQPDLVAMNIPENWGTDKQVAEVVLTPEQIKQASSASIRKKPYIIMDSGQRVDADVIVTINTPPKGEGLESYTITNVKLGFLTHLVGSYRVNVEKLQDLYSHVNIRASKEAKLAYESMHYQVILEINVDTTETQEKPLQYNFPQEYVRKNEIVLNQEPVVARFQLVPVTSPGTPPKVD